MIHSALADSATKCAVTTFTSWNYDSNNEETIGLMRNGVTFTRSSTRICTNPFQARSSLPQRYENAANFAFTNRAVLTDRLCKGLKAELGEEVELSTLYDVSHNIAKIEDHVIHGKTVHVSCIEKGDKSVQRKSTRCSCIVCKPVNRWLSW